MGRIKEPLSNGVMTGPDPAVLPPGTLSYMRNMVYKPSTLALQRATGRTVWGAATGTSDDVTGLRNFLFDNGDHYLLAQVSATGGNTPGFVTAFVEGNGTFDVLTANVSASTSLEIVHYSNRFYAFNGNSNLPGITANAAIYLSATAQNTPPILRQHGMAPVTAPASAAASGSALSAANFAGSASGWYEYWTTEVIQYIQDGVPKQEIESGFTGTPLNVYVASTAVAPVLTMPALSNVSATHWRIYRSPVKSYSTDRMYPDGFQVATQSTASAQYTDTSTSTQGSYVFGSALGYNINFLNPANASASDTNYATITGSTVGRYGGSSLICSGFNFGGFKGPILGIEIVLRAFYTGGVPPLVKVAIFKGVGAASILSSPYGIRSAYVTATVSPQDFTLGGPTDTWVAPESPKFVDTDFDGSMNIGILSVYGGNISVDSIRARVYYGAGQTEAAIIPYPTVVYTFSDTTVEVPKNGLPPLANTGDIYQDSLVTNSMSEPKLVRYSFPGMPDSFPSTYYLSFNTKDNDLVTLVKRVNNTLVVGLSNSIWRVNYLPSERDASFDRGVAVEPISRMYGVVNPMCACTFSVDGGSERMAFVSQKGIHVTDGYHISTQTQNQNWRLVLSTAPGVTSIPIALINDPENQEILFYYRNDGISGNEKYMCLHMNYSLTHVGTLHGDIGPSRTFEESLKISGPVCMRNYDAGTNSRAGVRSAWTVPRVNGSTTVFIGYGAGTDVASGPGKVYYETGTTLPSQDNVAAFKTRRMYLAGEAMEFRLNEAYGYLGSYTTAVGALGIDMACLTVKTNDDTGEITQTAKTVAFAGRDLGKWQFRQMAEGLVLSAAVTGNPNNDLAWEYLLLDGENFGAEDSGD